MSHSKPPPRDSWGGAKAGGRSFSIGTTSGKGVSVPRGIPLEARSPAIEAALESLEREYGGGSTVLAADAELVEGERAQPRSSPIVPHDEANCKTCGLAERRADAGASARAAEQLAAVNELLRKEGETLRAALVHIQLDVEDWEQGNETTWSGTVLGQIKKRVAKALEGEGPSDAPDYGTGGGTQW